MRILLTHTPHARLWYGEKAIQELSLIGEVILKETDSEWQLNELIEAIQDVDVVVSDRSTPAPAKLFEESNRLLAFVRCAMDTKNIDIQSASDNGVLVTHAGPGFVPAVSEWIIGQVVNLFRDIPRYVLNYRQNMPVEPHMGRQISGATIGIVGFGNISRYLCPILKAMNTNIIAHDPYVDIPSSLAVSSTLDELLTKSDIVICLAAYNDKTENLFNDKTFSLMKKSSYFINASRGGLIDEKSLEKALDSGRIAGVAIDVGRNHDNLPSLNIARRADVIASPHIGGLVPEAINFQALQTVQQVYKIKNGEIPEGAINAGANLRLNK